MAKHNQRAIHGGTDSARVERMEQWSRARNEGIREGFLMAMNVVSMLPDASAAFDAINVRARRHFGRDDWRGPGYE